MHWIIRGGRRRIILTWRGTRLRAPLLGISLALCISVPTLIKLVAYALYEFMTLGVVPGVGLLLFGNLLQVLGG